MKGKSLLSIYLNEDLISRTKRTALLQRFKMASRSAAEWLQKGWLQQSHILAAQSSALKPFASDKQRFSSGEKDSQKRC